MDTDLTEKVRNGELDGQRVWICHFNKPDIHKKALRKVAPILCEVTGNDELPKNKTIYYSKSHYRPIGAKGLPVRRFVSPVDATGYRSFCGNMLFTFTDKSVCEEAWRVMVQEYVDRLKQEKQSVSARIQSEIDELQKI